MAMCHSPNRFPQPFDGPNCTKDTNWHIKQKYPTPRYLRQQAPHNGTKQKAGGTCNLINAQSQANLSFPKSICDNDRTVCHQKSCTQPLNQASDNQIGTMKRWLGNACKQ